VHPAVFAGLFAVFAGLFAWRSDILATNPPTFCLIDSGDYTDAVYEFVRQVGGSPFAASKGYAANRFFLGQDNPTRRVFDNVWAGLLPADRVWLYHVNTEHWKQQVHERFAIGTFDEQHQFNDGSLSLFASSDAKKHLSFSHHIVAEERRDQFVEGKGMIRKWIQTNKNNHWLDATALALAASGVFGHRLIQSKTTAPMPTQQRPRPSTQFQNQRFKQREGGWVPRR
jgi:hypothetical protein